MKILLVEDDDFKSQDITSVLMAEIACKIIATKSVADSVRAIFAEEFDLVILDMALPSFTKSQSSTSGPSQPQGGVEILRALKMLMRKCPILIVSQYPSIEIDGKFVDLTNSTKALTRKYGLNILTPIIYENDTSAWKESFSTTIRTL